MTFTGNTRPCVGRAAAVALVLVGATIASGYGSAPSVAQTSPRIVIAAAPQASAPPGDEKSEKDVTPEEKMRRRFPQPVRVGFLIGLPVLDWDDSTIGFIQQVVRTPQGKIQLVVPYYSRLGWVRNGGPLDRWRRPVAVPIETVAILARQVDVLDMSRQEFDAAPTFAPSNATPLAADERIQIAITRR